MFVEQKRRRLLRIVEKYTQ